MKWDAILIFLFLICSTFILLFLYKKLLAYLVCVKRISSIKKHEELYNDNKLMLFFNEVFLNKNNHLIQNHYNSQSIDLKSYRNIFSDQLKSNNIFWILVFKLFSNQKISAFLLIMSSFSLFNAVNIILPLSIIFSSYLSQLFMVLSAMIIGAISCTFGVLICLFFQNDIIQKISYLFKMKHTKKKEVEEIENICSCPSKRKENFILEKKNSKTDRSNSNVEIENFQICSQIKNSSIFIQALYGSKSFLNKYFYFVNSIYGLLIAIISLFSFIQLFYVESTLNILIISIISLCFDFLILRVISNTLISFVICNSQKKKKILNSPSFAEFENFCEVMEKTFIEMESMQKLSEEKSDFENSSLKFLNKTKYEESELVNIILNKYRKSILDINLESSKEKHHHNILDQNNKEENIKNELSAGEIRNEYLHNYFEENDISDSNNSNQNKKERKNRMDLNNTHFNMDLDSDSIISNEDITIRIGPNQTNNFGKNVIKSSDKSRNYIENDAQSQMNKILRPKSVSNLHGCFKPKYFKRNSSYNDLFIPIFNIELADQVSQNVDQIKIQSNRDFNKLSPLANRQLSERPFEEVQLNFPFSSSNNCNSKKYFENLITLKGFEKLESKQKKLELLEKLLEICMKINRRKQLIKIFKCIRDIDNDKVQKIVKLQFKFNSIIRIMNKPHFDNEAKMKSSFKALHFEKFDSRLKYIDEKRKIMKRSKMRYNLKPSISNNSKFSIGNR